jgi:hypothetical protein
VPWPPVEHFHGPECDEFCSVPIGHGQLAIRDWYCKACCKRDWVDPFQGFTTGFCLSVCRPRDGMENGFRRVQLACPLSFFYCVSDGRPRPRIFEPDRSPLPNQSGSQQLRGRFCPHRGKAE